MKITVELNSRELSALAGDTKDAIKYDWEINVFTEAGEISKKGETAVFAGLYWALMCMLPVGIVEAFTNKWNKVIKDFSNGLDQSVDGPLIEPRQDA